MLESFAHTDDHSESLQITFCGQSSINGTASAPRRGVAEWHFPNDRWTRPLMALPRMHLDVCLMPVEAEQRWTREQITQLTSAVHQSGYFGMLNGYFHLASTCYDDFSMATHYISATGQQKRSRFKILGQEGLVHWFSYSISKSKPTQNFNAAWIWIIIKDLWLSDWLSDWILVKRKLLVWNRSRQSHWLESIISYNSHFSNLFSIKNVLFTRHLERAHLSLIKR